MLESIIEMYNANIQLIDTMIWGLILVCVTLDLIVFIRDRMRGVVNLTPVTTLKTDSGTKVRLLATSHEHGRYVVYYTNGDGIKVVTEQEFLELKADKQ